MGGEGVVVRWRGVRVSGTAFFLENSTLRRRPILIDFAPRATRGEDDRHGSPPEHALQLAAAGLCTRHGCRRHKVNNKSPRRSNSISFRFVFCPPFNPIKPAFGRLYET